MLPNESVVERNLRLFNCESPVAFVTGSAAPRVGRRVAETLLCQGFRILFHSHRESAEAVAAVEAAAQTYGKSGESVGLVTGPVEEESTVAAWVQRGLERFGRIDLLVNSAAIWEPMPLEKTRATDFERAFQVNLLGTTLCCQHFGLAMVEQASGGAIVNVGDWAVARPYRGFAAYFVGKAGVQTLTQTMAVELALRNPRVRVNALFPGPILLADSVNQERRQRIMQDCLLRRAGTADDLAQAVVFLATSPFVTGVSIPIDGGRSIWASDSSDCIAHPSVED